VPHELADGLILWNGVCLDISRRKLIELALTQTNQTLRRRIDALAALNQIAQALMSWTDLPAALRTVGAMLLPLFAAEHIAIWLRDEGRETITQIALIGHHEVTLGGTTLRLRDAPLARAALIARRGSVLDRGRADPVLISPPPSDLDALGGSALMQPLLVRGTGMGLLVVSGAEGRPTFTPADVELAQTIAGLLSSAIENGRLLQRTMAEAAQEERRRLARELHDSITQSLYSLTLLARAWSQMAAGATPADLADWFGQVEDIALQSLKEMRLLIYQLRSQEFDEQGLAEALRHRLEAVEGRSGVKVRLDAEGYRQPVSPGVESQLYAIVQEAMNNALRHAGATMITIVLRSDHEGALVEVADNGRGFDPDEPSAGLGLTTMRERAEAIGGRLSVTSAPGRGTTVRVLLPYKAAAIGQARVGPV
ncbi:MAG: GAF domain-containing sensor histidine kinase, partial [Chloroflexales bacterium]|nr:GAF domain-containing sensor histidine kinase [Chloroflexales bacterium]